MSTVNVADLTRLAQVDSANLFTTTFLGGPQTLLQVVAQRSGFNWELRLQPGIPDPLPIAVDYFPYLVLETKSGPDWPDIPHQGPGPVVPSTTLHTWVTRFGSKGIEVIGRDFRKKLDYPKAAAA